MQAADDAILRFKAQFHSSHRIHFNNAGQAPICQPALAAIEECAKIFYADGAFCFKNVDEKAEQARGEVAAFLGAQAKEVSFYQSTAGAISQVALGLDLKSGDEIIVYDQEYPSNFYPWLEAARRTGAKLVMAKSQGDQRSVSVAEIERLISSRTRVIAISWVQFRTGAICDLKALSELTRAKGVFVCADIVQGAGLLPFNFSELGIDAACGGSHKWLASAHGAGYLCLREEQQEKLRPLQVGAMTFGTPDTPIDHQARPHSGPLRFEAGGKAYIEIIALGKACRFYGEIGMDRIAAETEWLSRRLAHGLRERGYTVHSPHGLHHRGSIVNFTPGANSCFSSLDKIALKLLENEISHGRREPGIRLSPHAFNTIDEVDRVLALL